MKMQRTLATLFCFMLLTLAELTAEKVSSAKDPDLIVYGATPGGIAAAVAASREGASVLLLEPTRHVGGLHTSGLSVAEWAQNWDTFGGILDEFFRRLGQAYGSKDRQYQWEPKVGGLAIGVPQRGPLLDRSEKEAF